MDKDAQSSPNDNTQGSPSKPMTNEPPVNQSPVKEPDVDIPLKSEPRALRALRSFNTPGLKEETEMTMSNRRTRSTTARYKHWDECQNCNLAHQSIFEQSFSVFVSYVDPYPQRFEGA